MKLLILLPLLAAVALAGCIGQQAQVQEQSAPPAGPEPGPGETQPGEAPATAIVDMTSSGFIPNTVRIAAGGTVTFKNTDTAPHRPASDVHPTHCVYKGCGVFDAKLGIQPGEEWQFTFDLAGSWEYHDHLSPGRKGTVVVV